MTDEMIQLFAAIAARLIGLLSSLSMLVMLMAGLANSKPPQIQQGKWMGLGILVVQVLSLAAAVWLMTQRRNLHASIAGLVPLACVVVLLIVLVRIEW